MQMTVGRFAPTPSGEMHLGNVYCALISYLSAKAQGGKWVLRIEDLDAARCPHMYADAILHDLEWLGFEWDGEVLYQSERSDVYAAYYKKLEAAGLTYPCFCTRASLHAASAPHADDGTPIYSGACARLTDAEISAKLAAGKRPAYRVRVPDESVTFVDTLCGTVTQNLQRECGDFVVRRADGVYAYQLAVVVDDALSGVTEVVRGDDLLSSTPRQIWLCRTLGFPPPRYAHIPLLTDGDGRRLSKRDGDTVSAIREKFSAKEIIGRLAFSTGLLDEPAPVSLAELLLLFRRKRSKPEKAK